MPVRALTDPDDEQLLTALRAGDEAAFRTLVARYTPVMRRIARTYVRTDALADEVVQESWLGVLRGLEGFEQRSSLKTWILRIVANRARTRGEREARSVPFSALAGDDPDTDVATVDPDRFLPATHARWPGHWTTPPAEWPEDRLLARETTALVLAAITALPPRQQQVITLRDVQGWSSEEVAGALSLSEGNQRVLLHRARAKVRAALEEAWS